MLPCVKSPSWKNWKIFFPGKMHISLSQDKEIELLKVALRCGKCFFLVFPKRLMSYRFAELMTLKFGCTMLVILNKFIGQIPSGTLVAFLESAMQCSRKSGSPKCT